MHTVGSFDEQEQKIVSEDYIDLIVENNAALRKLLAETDDIILGYEFELRLAIIYVQKELMNRVLRELNVQSNMSYPLLFGVLDMDSLDVANISQVQNHPTLDLKGRGVLVGFIDTGIDYTHPAFVYEDGTTKIKAIWDQTIFTGNHPEGFKYGTEYTETQINQALRVQDPYSIVPSQDEIGHGTFLAGIAAGREPGRYLGVAPESEIVCVKLAPAKRFSKESSMIFKEDAVVFQDIDMLMGMYYLMDKAQKLGRPLSITIGLGTTQGGHDGATYPSLTGNIPGMVLSTACGNEGNSMNHAEGTIVRTGETCDLELNIDERDRGLAIYIWGYTPDVMSISLLSPSGEYIEKIPVKNSAHANFKLIFFDTTIWVNYFFAAETNGDQLTVIRLKNPEHGTWKITVYGDNIINGKFHAWLLPRDWIHDGTHFINSTAEYTVTELANSTNLLSVGAYNQVDQHVFVQSSRGPTRNGMMRPDILAPGVNVSGPLPNKTYGVKSGTSVAAAHVAGAAALLLQWGIVNGNYKSMNAQTVRTVLIAGAKRLPNIKYPNTQFGYGQLDLLQSFKELNTITPQGEFYFSDYYATHETPQRNAAADLVPYGGSIPPKAGLQVSVFASRKAQPLTNALVRIQSPSTGEVVAELYTNSSGQTETIDLTAPPQEYSQNAQYKLPPYAQYNVEVYADGFQPVHVGGVQLLNGDTSLQDVVLQLQTQSSQWANLIQIAPHTLWAGYSPKAWEDPIKLIRQSESLFMLDTLEIPEIIVVHTGPVNDRSVRNYAVPFKDYIKNVASCVIYPTWPKETIMANVLAILSFALNRVYTQWYQNQGYSFTITSSTAVDQAFIYGRNIFKKVSLVVDELFTTYTTKPNIEQPLFTQYCDGNRINCPNWMSQWGSKALGDQGYSAIDILKHYYGYDLYTKEAEQVAGIPASYSGRPLAMGAAGTAVRTIQTQLNTIGYQYPMLEAVRVDGVFDQATKQAVESFQRICNLDVDGIVGFSTWYRIAELYVSVIRIDELG